MVVSAIPVRVRSATNSPFALPPGMPPGVRPMFVRCARAERRFGGVKFPKKGYIGYTGDSLAISGDSDTDERQFLQCEVDGDEDPGENQLGNLIFHFGGNHFRCLVHRLSGGFLWSH